MVLKHNCIGTEESVSNASVCIISGCLVTNQSKHRINGLALVSLMKAYSLGLEPFDAKKRCHQYQAAIKGFL